MKFLLALCSVTVTRGRRPLKAKAASCWRRARISSTWKFGHWEPNQVDRDTRVEVERVSLA
jgi:hypothetical protein